MNIYIEHQKNFHLLLHTYTQYFTLFTIYHVSNLFLNFQQLVLPDTTSNITCTWNGSTGMVQLEWRPCYIGTVIDWYLGSLTHQLFVEGTLAQFRTAEEEATF